MILRKTLRVIEMLPLTADDVYSVRSAHSTFANVLQELSTNQVCVCVCVYSVHSAHNTFANVL